MKSVTVSVFVFAATAGDASRRIVRRGASGRRASGRTGSTAGGVTATSTFGRVTVAFAVMGSGPAATARGVREALGAYAQSPADAAASATPAAVASAHAGRRLSI